MASSTSRSTKLFRWGTSFAVPDTPVDSSAAVMVVPSGSLRELAREMPGFSTPTKAPRIASRYSMSAPPKAEAARRVVPVVSHRQRRVSQSAAKDTQVRSSQYSTGKNIAGASKVGVKVDVIGDGRLSGGFPRDIATVRMSQPRSPRV